jgi:hypothetical protein
MSDIPNRLASLLNEIQPEGGENAALTAGNLAAAPEGNNSSSYQLRSQQGPLLPGLTQFRQQSALVSGRNSADYSDRNLVNVSGTLTTIGMSSPSGVASPIGPLVSLSPSGAVFFPSGNVSSPVNTIGMSSPSGVASPISPLISLPPSGAEFIPSGNVILPLTRDAIVGRTPQPVAPAGQLLSMASLSESLSHVSANVLLTQPTPSIGSQTQLFRVQRGSWQADGTFFSTEYLNDPDYIRLHQHSQNFTAADLPWSNRHLPIGGLPAIPDYARASMPLSAGIAAALIAPQSPLPLQGLTAVVSATGTVIPPAVTSPAIAAASHVDSLVNNSPRYSPSPPNSEVDDGYLENDPQVQLASMKLQMAKQAASINHLKGQLYTKHSELQAQKIANRSEPAVFAVSAAPLGTEFLFNAHSSALVQPTVPPVLPISVPASAELSNVVDSIRGTHRLSNPRAVPALGHLAPVAAWSTPTSPDALAQAFRDGQAAGMAAVQTNAAQGTLSSYAQAVQQLPLSLSSALPDHASHQVRMSEAQQDTIFQQNLATALHLSINQAPAVAVTQPVVASVVNTGITAPTTCVGEWAWESSQWVFNHGPGSNLSMPHWGPPNSGAPLAANATVPGAFRQTPAGNPGGGGGDDDDGPGDGRGPPGRNPLGFPPPPPPAPVPAAGVEHIIPPAAQGQANYTNNRLRAPDKWNKTGSWRNYLKTLDLYWQLTVPPASLTDSFKLSSIVVSFLAVEWQDRWYAESAHKVSQGLPVGLPQFLDWAKKLFVPVTEGLAAMKRWHDFSQAAGSSTAQHWSDFQGILADVQATCGSSEHQVISAQLQSMKWVSTCKSGQVQEHDPQDLPAPDILYKHSLLNPLSEWKVHATQSSRKVRIDPDIPAAHTLGFKAAKRGRGRGNARFQAIEVDAEIEEAYEPSRDELMASWHREQSARLNQMVAPPAFSRPTGYQGVPFQDSSGRMVRVGNVCLICGNYNHTIMACPNRQHGPDVAGTSASHAAQGGGRGSGYGGSGSNRGGPGTRGGYPGKGKGRGNY